VPKKTDFDAPPQKTPNKRTSGWSKFVRGDLTDGDKADCRAWTVFDERGGDMLLALVTQGYRLTIKQDGNSEGALVFLNGPDSPHPHSGWTLTGRGSNPLKALKQVCFRHFVMFGEDWPLFDDSNLPDPYND